MVYGGFLTLTYSHLHHYWHFPTMVGFCHGGNMLSNHDSGNGCSDVDVSCNGDDGGEVHDGQQGHSIAGLTAFPQKLFVPQTSSDQINLPSFIQSLQSFAIFRPILSNFASIHHRNHFSPKSISVWMFLQMFSLKHDILSHIISFLFFSSSHNTKS